MKLLQLPTLIRRSILISILPIALGFFIGGLAVFILLIPSVLIKTRSKHTNDLFRFGRVTAMLAWYLLLECLGVLSAGTLWILSGGGLLKNARWMQRLHGKVQYRWTSGLLFGAKIFLNANINFPDCSPLRSGPMIIISQHRSFFDACIPSVLIGKAKGRIVLRHVLKSELLLSPSLDLFGHRLPNYFVTRKSPNSDKEISAIRSLGLGLDSDACVIFPEGTFYSKRRFAASLAEIEKTDRERLLRVQKLRHVLPIRTGGILALLDATPDADLVVIGHSGFERFSSFQDIFRNVPFTSPINITLKRIPHREMPANDNDRVKFLDEQWLDIDLWNEKIRQFV
ncbi:MAG: 1-acyl-sn-glycerol-3-phosphate acyltransferase [Acidimicrobiales bacterium]|nr:1-acyl-sn-glycerol-3-phosphate acyltransferase [Acidimicrobiales bacterium]